MHYQHEPSRLALLVQQELDDIRDCIVSAFVTAFPAVFSKKDVAVAYDNGVQERVVWSIFHRNLLAHFYSYHRIGYHEGVTALFQHRCLLDDLSDSATIACNRDSRATESSDHSTLDSRFREAYIARCDDEGRIESESDQAFSKRVLEFFLPVFKSLKAKTAVTLEALCNRLAAWREELQINVNADDFIRLRLGALGGVSDPVPVSGRQLSSKIPGDTGAWDSAARLPPGPSGREDTFTWVDEPREILGYGYFDGVSIKF